MANCPTSRIKSETKKPAYYEMIDNFVIVAGME